MANIINEEKIKKLVNSYILFEIANHGVDPRKTLEGTVLRNNSDEGYKYRVFEKNHKKILLGAPYVPTIIDALPGENLVSHFQKERIVKRLKDLDNDDFENALKLLYYDNDDARAFEEIVSIIGGAFDVLGFLFFIKDKDRYLPMRSNFFDDRLSLLGVKSNLAGQCSWSKYNEFIGYVEEIQKYLNTHLNKSITLLDAHSFLWILSRLSEYNNNELQLVEHWKYGVGVVEGFENDLIHVRFGKKSMSFLSDKSFNSGILKFTPIDYDLHNKDTSEEVPLSNKAVEVAEALLKLVANRKRVTTYSGLSEMTDSKPSPYYEMRMLLDAINKRCDKMGLPYISAMVVNKKTGLPGEGFRDLCINTFGYPAEMSTQEIFERELDKIGKCDEWHKLADYIGIEMPVESEDLLPEEVEEKPDEPIVEGAKKTITVNSYERDPKAKKKCKDYYMKRDGHITCQICGFDFGKAYGSEYANKIHIHHVIPISEIGEEYVVDPIKDLIPVCPNCHMILHTGKGISVDELKKTINSNR